jgi:hypothetical protein
MEAIDWLLESDPAIRWQTMRDLCDLPAAAVDAERAKVATYGWGPRLVNRLAADGRVDAERPEWDCLRGLLLLRDMGWDPTSDDARSLVGRVSELTWHGQLPQDIAWHGRPFFAGEVEPCINGRVVVVGAYTGQDVRVIVDRLLDEQCADGGWNCEAGNGSTRGSFHTTICVLEGLLEFDRATGDSGDVRVARHRGQEYLLDRRLLRRLSTSEVIDEAFTRFAYPTGYQYDLLRATDYLRSAEVTPDERSVEAVDIIRRRGRDGRWALDPAESNPLEFDMDERAGQPSRWNTLRALRVLRWADSRA